jgi:NADH:ubiquinone oxidoreductase subunit 5 (subunit L)/multisubunit Na+/H+ antiporter MnhA subunit
MNQMLLLLLIIIPAIVGLVMLFIPTRTKYPREALALVTASLLVLIAGSLWGKKLDLVIPWAGFGLDFQLRYYEFSQFIVAAVAGFSLLLSLYSVKFMAGRPQNNQFYGFLFISEAMALGATLANNLVLMLFFWEGLLITLYAMINLGHEKAYRTAMKTFIIVGLSDLCLMLGIAIAGAQANTLVMSEIHLTTAGINGIAFVLMMIGAMAKAGAMPFHTWIPDAAVDAPLPFMAFLPAALEKLLGIYLVARIALDFFTMDLAMELFLMTIGAVTIVLAVMMALIQRDFKRLLSYHAISQVGYMILGIGTGVPVGVAGGLFHMINHAMYKCCLFLTSGSVERQAGTTDLRQLGGLRQKMPWTFVSFLVAAASISGVPPFNGFVSKEMVFEGALETGYPIFFYAAVIGAFFTLASFLKLGHASFFGKLEAKHETVTESHWTMIVPMAFLALGCILFGVIYRLPLDHLIKPSLTAGLGHAIEEIHFEYHLGWLFWVTIGLIAAATLNHWIGVKLSGRGVGASEHIHHLPGLSQIYDLAEKHVFDPYVQGKVIFRWLALALFRIDRAIDWVYQGLAPALAGAITSIRNIHNGLYANYLSWSVGGLLLILIYITWAMR